LLEILNQRTHPGRELTVEADKNAVGNESLGKFLRTAHVQDQGVFDIHRFFECFGAERLSATRHHGIDAVVAHFVHHGIFGEVLRRFGKAVGYFVDELLARAGAQGVVELFLLADGGNGFLAHVFAAGRTRAVCRINNHLVGQGHDLLCRLSYSIPARSRSVSSPLIARSGRPTSPMNSVSPVNKAWSRPAHRSAGSRCFPAYGPVCAVL
jgi:hypothetical protein